MRTSERVNRSRFPAETSTLTSPADVVRGATATDAAPRIVFAVCFSRLRRAGATHVVFTKNTFWWMQSYPEFAQYLAQSARLIEATPRFFKRVIPNECKQFL